MSGTVALRVSDPERLRRWRMVLGGADDGSDNSDTAGAAGVTSVQLDVLRATAKRPFPSRPTVKDAMLAVAPESTLDIMPLRNCFDVA